MTDAVRPGRVEWTGDNPFIYLKTDPAGDWSALALHFRVAVSPHGAGRLALGLEAPYAPDAADAARVAFTDNPALARYLIDVFVRRLPLFRPAGAALDALKLVEGAAFETATDGGAAHAERAEAGERSLELRWEGLEAPFAVQVDPAASATGAHEMLSVFRTAATGRIVVDGRPLPGATIRRDFLAGPAQSAALAFSETWIAPPA